MTYNVLRGTLNTQPTNQVYSQITYLDETLYQLITYTCAWLKTPDFKAKIKQETHHEMRIPERDVTYIVLSVYLLTLLSIDVHWTGSNPIKHKMDHTQVNLIWLKTFNLHLTSQNMYSTLIGYADCGSLAGPVGPYIPSTG